MGAAAISLAEGVWRIPTTINDLINTFVFKDDDGQLTLVDAGIKSAPPRILAGLREIGSSPTDVTRIVLTHAHGDHAGGLAALRQQTGAPVAVHQQDAGSVREGRAARPDQSTMLGRLVTRYVKFGATPVATELTDGQVLDVGGGLRILHTPGHTPGHMSLLHESSRVLITGDAIWNMRSRLTWPVLSLCTDGPTTMETAHVLGELEYDIVGFTHGPEIREGAREAVRGFLAHPRRFSVRRPR